MATTTQGYTPAWQVIANGADLTRLLKIRLLSLVVNDEVGTNSDSVEIKIDDRDGAIAIPSFGADLEVSIGYVETGLVYKGRYRVDEIECEGPERAILIRARSSDSNSTSILPHFKAGTSRTWIWPAGTAQAGQLMKLKDIAGIIGGQDGLGAKVDADLGEQYPVSDQQAGESNVHYLRKEVENLGGKLKVAVGSIVIFKQGSGLTVSGSPAQTITVIPSDCMRWRWLGARRNAHNKVTAWYPEDDGTEVSYTATGEDDDESEDSDYHLPERFPKGQAPLAPEYYAKNAAHAKLRDLGIASDSLSLSMIGNAKIACECQLEVSGFKDGVDDTWTVARVQHRIDNNGYSSEVECIKAPNVE